MNWSIKQLFALFVVIFIIGCTKEIDDLDKYKRPSWLAGKLYTQVKNEKELSVFARCLEYTGYDTVINTSGSFTLFAPSDSAFSVYFKEHSYASVEDVPIDILLQLVKFHIVQNPWSTDQLRSLDVYGWIDSNDVSNDEPKGFKRETLLKEKNRKYGVTVNINKRIVITDTINSPWYRRQYTDSRKYAPLFYKELWDIYKLKSEDYAFYFGRSFESGSMYYAGAKIIKANVFAENGFIHVIDKIIEPLQNAYQILDRKTGPASYSRFLDLVNIFPEFKYDNERTEDQPGADQGLAVDSLFNINYPQLAFNISNERTKAPTGTLGLPSNVTIRYHHGMAAPTNEALEDFVNEYLAIPNGWGSIESAPLHIKRMIANTHLSVNAIFPSDFSNGFYSGEDDMMVIDPSTIIQKEFGSNCTFIGLKEALVPRAFTSLVAPVYLQKGYSTAMYLIENSGLLPALKKPANNYSLYIEPDQFLRKDSSLVYNQQKNSFTAYQITPQSKKAISLSTTDLRTLLLNHIAIEQPLGFARKEFIRNLAGNFIIINNETGEVSGTAPTTKGYQGLELTQSFPVKISNNTDNGETFEIENLLNFGVKNLFQKIQTSYPKFHALIVKAGLLKDQFSYSFTSDNEFYTVFIPNDTTLTNYHSDTISITNLKNFILMHFIQGSMIFTDGRSSAGYYETLRIDESSTPYVTYFTKIHIVPGTDMIRITASGGGDYLVVNESDKSNIITGITVTQGQLAYPDIRSTGVIHEITNVLRADLVDKQ